MTGCPRCSREMEAVQVAGVGLEACTVCRGSWFRAQDLERILELQPADLARIPFYEGPQSRENGAWDPPPAFCPSCSAPLRSRRFREGIPVITQACPNRHGIWLGEGELCRIKQYCDSLAASAPLDGARMEEVAVATDGEKERPKGGLPLYGVKGAAQKGRLALTASLLLAVVVLAVFLSLTANTPELGAISKEFATESAQSSGEIVKQFSSDKAEKTLARKARTQKERRSSSSLESGKASKEVEEAELTEEELEDKALAEKIDAFLASRKSPMTGTGEIFVAAGRDTGVNPILSVAIAGKESSFGRYCFAPYNAWGMKAPQYLAGFSSWEKGIWANFRYLLKRYGKVSSPYQCQGYCVPDHPWMEDVASIMNAILQQD